MSELNGLLLLDKPEGISSHDLVSKLRKILGTKNIGHCGTLDPLATGLMVMLVGEATKISQFILEKDKSYEVELQLGVETDTYDITGTVVSKNDSPVSDFDLQQKISLLSGDFDWPVPSYSAVKVNGERLYDLARSGQQIASIPIKRMSFYDLQILSAKDSKATVRLSCSKGSFIRSWVHYLGKSVGVGATMLRLRRLRSEPFTLAAAQTLEQVVAVGPKLLDMEMALSAIPKKYIQGLDEHLLRNGQISVSLKQSLIADIRHDQVELVKEFRISSRSSGKLMAIVGYKPGAGFQIRRVFNL